MGPRVIMVEDHGLLVGLLSVKDMLRQHAAHAQHSQKDDSFGVNEFEDVLEEARAWLSQIIDRIWKPRQPPSSLRSPTVVFDADYELPERPREA